MKGLVIGCGKVVTRGWDHLDLRPYRHVKFVQSAVDLSNILSGTYEVVTARDVIEHISWRDVPRALGEWLRVLVPGGALEVETPNALELVEQISRPDRFDLPRWCGNGPESDWARFCRTAFGHQDYPENTHLSYFTPQWLRELLLEAGAARVVTVAETLQRFRLSAVAP